jgi:hypothetical protein
LKIRIDLLDDNGRVLDSRMTDPWRPIDFRTPPDKPILIPREPNPDGVSNGQYVFWGYTLATRCTVELNRR